MRMVKEFLLLFLVWEWEGGDFKGMNRSFKYLCHGDHMGHVQSQYMAFY
jgi:hypothetical protein